MDERELILKFWQKESTATRKVLERVPEEKSDYRPDPRSRSARELAWVIVREEKSLADAITSGRFEWTDVPVPETMAEVFATYAREHDETMRRLEQAGAAAWEREIPFVMGGQEFFRESGAGHAWIILFDQVHHRGQLSTYLRPMGAKVPSIYGPSGDEA
jgi:uncharacterized damage-inducible protein DinB